MLNRARLATGALLAGTALFVTTAIGSATSAPVAGAAASPNANWSSCNNYAAYRAPRVVVSRIKQVTTSHRAIPSSFWQNAGYRTDIEKIVCYESTYRYHANDAGAQYGWYQMSRSLIQSEGVSWGEYWKGTQVKAAGWFQCLAGERYILHRYGNPAAAWAHERNYGWY